MKIGRQYLGKVVEIQWCDPNFDRVDVNDSMLKGRAALATWKEYGVVHDVTDGVVLIVHSAASMPGRAPGETDEVGRTAVHEALIEKVTVYAPTAAEAAS